MVTQQYPWTASLPPMLQEAFRARMTAAPAPTPVRRAQTPAPTASILPVGPAIPAPMAVTAAPPQRELYGRSVPGQAYIPIYTGAGNPMPALPTPAPAPAPTPAPQPNPSPAPAPAPAPGQRVPVTPLPAVGSRTGVGKGLDAQGNFQFNAPATMNLYSPEEWIAAQPPYVPAPQSSAAPVASSMAQPRDLPAYALDPNYNPTSAEVDAFGGRSAWVAAYERQTGNRVVAPANPENPNGYGDYMTAGRDASGTVTYAGAMSGYKVGDTAAQPNRYVGSSVLNDQLQSALQSTPGITAEEAARLSAQQTELQTAYRLGIVSEPQALSAMQVLANNTRGQVAARVVGGAFNKAMRGAPNTAPNPNELPPGQRSTIRPPSVGDAGLAVYGYSEWGEPLGPNGRTFTEITGTDYLSEAEMNWYRDQVAGQQAAPRITPPSLNALAAPAAPVSAINPPATSGNWSDWGELPGGQMASWAVNHGYTANQIIYQGQSVFIPEVEQWRPLVAQYFAPGDVNHALWLIQRESRGQNVTQIGGGPGTGLFQIEHGGVWPGRPSQQQLLDPATNIAVAAKMVYGG